MMEEDFKMVKKYGKVFGVFNGLQPNLIVTDAELIRNVFIKDSRYFINHVNLQDPEDERFRSVRKMVFFLRDQEWKDVRLAITKAFSPAKIKLVTCSGSEKKKKRLRLWLNLTDQNRPMHVFFIHRYHHI